MQPQLTYSSYIPHAPCTFLSPRQRTYIGTAIFISFAFQLKECAYGGVAPQHCYSPKIGLSKPCNVLTENDRISQQVAVSRVHPLKIHYHHVPIRHLVRPP